jgi:hypothetical protein
VWDLNPRGRVNALADFIKTGHVMDLTCVDAATDGDLRTYSAQPAARAGEWR